jgi:hypothetical protein
VRGEAGEAFTPTFVLPRPRLKDGIFDKGEEIVFVSHVKPRPVVREFLSSLRVQEKIALYYQPRTYPTRLLAITNLS